MGDDTWLPKPLQGRKGHLNSLPDSHLGFSLCKEGQGGGTDTNVWLLPPEAWSFGKRYHKMFTVSQIHSE